MNYIFLFNEILFTSLLSFIQPTSNYLISDHFCPSLINRNLKPILGAIRNEFYSWLVGSNVKGNHNSLFISSLLFFSLIAVRHAVIYFLTRFFLQAISLFSRQMFMVLLKLALFFLSFLLFYFLSFFLFKIHFENFALC